MKTVRWVGYLLVSLLVLGETSHAEDLVVPRQYATISQAVQAASPQGDRILVVDKGNYAETIRIDRSVSLVSDPPGARISKPDGAGVAIVKGARTVTIQGFLIDKCRGEGIRVDPGNDTSVSLVLRKTAVNATVANTDTNPPQDHEGLGTGICFLSGTGNRLEIAEECRFAGNARRAVVSWVPLDMRAANSTFSENGREDGNNAGSIHLIAYGSIQVENCVFRENKNQDAIFIEVAPSAVSSREPYVSIEIDQCQITAAGRVGVHVVNVQNVPLDCNVRIEDLVVKQAVNEGVRIDSGLGSRLNLDIRDSTIEGAGRAGVMCSRCDNMKIAMRNVFVSHAKKEGISVLMLAKGILDLELDNVAVTGCESAGLYIRNAGGFRIRATRSVFTGNKVVGLRIGTDPDLVDQTRTAREQGRIEKQSAVFDNSRFSGSGLGVWVSGLDPDTTSLDLTSCTIEGNVKEGIRATQTALSVKEGRIERNGIGVALKTRSESTEKPTTDSETDQETTAPVRLATVLRMDGVVVQKNDGAAVYAQPLPSTIEVSGCEIADNGGAAFSLSGSFLISNQPSAIWQKKDAGLLDRVLILSNSCSARIAKTTCRGNGEGTLLAHSAVIPVGEGLDWPDGENPPVQLPLSALAVKSKEQRDLVSRFQKYEAIAHMTQQATAWHTVGKPELSRIALGDAERTMKSFYPLEAGSSAPCKQYSDLIEQCKAAIENTASVTNSSLLVNDKGAASSEQEVRERMNARVAAYVELSISAASFPKRCEVPIETNIEQVRTTLVQSILDDLVSVVSNEKAEDAPRCTAFSVLTQCFADGKGRASKVFATQDDRIAALNWLDEQVRTVVAKPSPLSVAYEQFAVNQYNKAGSSAKETAHLELLTTLPITPEERQTALTKLAQLYREFWKIPEKAIETEKRIVEAFPKSAQDYSARLAMAKDLYENKDYARAISELEQLLTVLPKDHECRPVRLLLGLSHLANGNHEDARDQFGRVVNMDQGEYKEKALYLLGYSYVCEKKYDMASKPFRDLLGLFPNGVYTERAKSFLSKIENPK